MQFLINGDHVLSSKAVQVGYLAGMDGVPWPCRLALESGILSVHRQVSDAGVLHIPCKVSGRREMMLSTATLCENSEPYCLVTELARGTLNRVRNQLDAWTNSGLQHDAHLDEQIRQSTGAFISAVTGGNKPDVAARHALLALDYSLRATDSLADTYTAQALAVRHRSAGKFSTLLGASLDETALAEEASDEFERSLNSAVVSPVWSHVEEAEGSQQWQPYDQQIQWCRSRGIRVICGPLVHFRTGSIPSWSYLWEDDFDALQQYILQYLLRVVDHFQNQVQLWHCSAGLNLPGTISLTEEQRLRLALSSLEVIHNRDPRTPVFLSVDQPWSEYLGHENLDLSAFDFADAVVRADIGISGIGLEIKTGNVPGQTYWRDLVQISQQIDRWSMFGLPLVITITAGDIAPSESNDESLPTTLSRWVAMLLAKNSVQGVIWNRNKRSFGSEAATGLSVSREETAILRHFRELREQHVE